MEPTEDERGAIVDMGTLANWAGLPATVEGQPGIRAAMFAVLGVEPTAHWRVVANIAVEDYAALIAEIRVGPENSAPTPAQLSYMGLMGHAASVIGGVELTARETTEQAAAPAPKKEKAPEQASTSTATPADGPTQVVFNGDDTKLSADGQSALESVLGKLSANENARVQLMAYAAGEDLTSSKARRISLSRALSVRSFLIEKGVRSTRIDVRALGDKSEDEPQNRVDVNVIER